MKLIFGMVDDVMESGDLFMTSICAIVYVASRQETNQNEINNQEEDVEREKKSVSLINGCASKANAIYSSLNTVTTADISSTLFI